MASDRPNPSHIERQRVPLESRVSLKFKEFRGFLTEYSSNVSVGGMFLRTDRPQPPGSVFDFEFKLADEFSLINGIGEVVWARQSAAGPDNPAGMGVRFLHLDGAGEKLILRMVKEHIEKGGVPFELGESDSSVPSPSAGEPAGRAGSLRREESRFAPSPEPKSNSELDAQLEKERLEEVQARLQVEREELRADLAAFDPSPRALDPEAEVESPPEPEMFREVAPPSDELSSIEGFDIEDEPLAETAVLAAQPTPSYAPEPQIPPPVVQTSLLDDSPLADTVTESSPTTELPPVADVPTAPFETVSNEEPDSDPPPLPPGFDEVTRALGRTEPAVRYADPSLTPGNQPPSDELADSETLPGLDQPAYARTSTSYSSSASTPSSGAWQVPDTILPYEAEQKKGGNALLIGIGLIVAILFGIGYYLSTTGNGTPVFVPDSPPSETAGPPLPAATNPASGEPTNVDEPPTLESLVGLPETEDGQTSSGEDAPAPVSAAAADEPDPRPEPPIKTSETPPPVAASQRRVTLVQEIRWTTTDRATVVTLIGNGQFTDEDFTTFRLQGGQPREVVRLVGIEEGYRSGVLSIGTDTVRQIRLGHHIKTGGPELHVVFDLEHIGAKLFSVEPKGNQLIVTLGPT